MSYNLLGEEWIPVLYNNGKFHRVSILEAFKQAREIHCIASARPLDHFAINRFLTTLLYWKADLGGGVEQIRKALLNGEMPSKVFDGIKDERRCFDLLDDKAPFMQDPTVKKDKKGKVTQKKSVGSLFAEFACGTNIAHFHHGDDKNMRLCLPCVTLGMLRVVSWTQSGGQGLTPSVHGAPPIMAIATGNNLSVTLGLNLVPLEGKMGKAKWSGHFMPTDSAKGISYLEAFTWNPRRIYLPEPQQGFCWNCGLSNVPVVGQIVYEKNENAKSLKNKNKTIPFIWKDPSAFYFPPKEKSKAKKKEATGENKTKDENRTAKSYDEKDASDNSDLLSIFANHDVNPPVSKVVAENKNHRRWHSVIPTTDGKAKTFDNRQIEMQEFSPDGKKSFSPTKSKEKE